MGVSSPLSLTGSHLKIGMKCIQVISATLNLTYLTDYLTAFKSPIIWIRTRRSSWLSELSKLSNFLNCQKNVSLNVKIRVTLYNLLTFVNALDNMSNIFLQNLLTFVNLSSHWINFTINRYNFWSSKLY